MFTHEIFQTIYYGNSLESWIISLFFLIGGIIVGRLLYWFSSKILKKLTSKTTTSLDDIIIDMMEEPMVGAVILWGLWIALGRLELSVGFDNGISTAYKILIVLNITWFAARMVNSLIKEYLIPFAEKEDNSLDGHIISIIQKTLAAVIWIIGGIMALKNAGVDVGALIAGLGIGGLAFALAAQDTVKNIFGGFTIFTDKPFRIGDLIKVNDITGFVEDIGMRSIRLRTLAGRLVTIPNYKIVDSSIENITLEPSRRIELKLGLTYSTSPDQMQKAIDILKNLATTNPEIEEKVQVFFSNYGPYAMEITCFYFIKKECDIMESQSKVHLDILNQFNTNKLSFAFPTQTLILEK